jgi:hypothetical protein
MIREFGSIGIMYFYKVSLFGFIDTGKICDVTVTRTR